MPDRPGGATPAGPVFFRDGGRGQSAFQVQRSCHRAGEAGIGERLRSDEVLRETTKLLPAPPMDHSQASHQEGIGGIGVKRGFRVARAPSPDARRGPPWPRLSPRRLRFRPPGCADRRGRLSEHGRPLAGGVERQASRMAPWPLGFTARVREKRHVPSSVSAHGASAVSPPARVPRARQTSGATSSPIERTDPSIIAVPTRPR